MRLSSDLPLELLEGSAAFQCPECGADVSVAVIAADELPETRGSCRGQDGLFRFYEDGGVFYQKALAGTAGSVSLAVYPQELSWIRLYVNEGAFPNTVRTVDKVLQLLPMRQLLTRHHALLLHSSRIDVGGKAVLFTAPSQTGKTTQARLWQRFEGAELLGNDRTVLRKQGEGFHTFGYPVDGSSPVYSTKALPLGAVVVLEQGRENQIRRLNLSEALKALMSQTAMDLWNSEQRLSTQQFWLELLTACPVYKLICTPEREAVNCLKQQLEKDEVIADGWDS